MSGQFHTLAMFVKRPLLEIYFARKVAWWKGSFINEAKGKQPTKPSLYCLFPPQYCLVQQVHTAVYAFICIEYGGYRDDMIQTCFCLITHDIQCAIASRVVWSHLGNKITQSPANPQWKGRHPNWCGHRSGDNSPLVFGIFFVRFGFFIFHT